jgi:hypothetical protein
MWIQSDRQNLVRMNIPEIDDAVDFNDNGTAQVPEDVGAQLIKQFDTIHEYKQ